MTDSCEPDFDLKYFSKYKLARDRRDIRDLKYQWRSESLPLSIDLRSLCSPVEDQGSMGSCTANALVGNLEFLERKKHLQFVDLSRLFIYYNERLAEHALNRDSGATLRDGIKVLKEFGVCAEKTWPYQRDLLFARPSTQAYREALLLKINKYERLTTLADMKDCLSSGFPFVFGIEVFDSLEQEEVQRTGRIPMPRLGERPLGGHALLAVGYNDREKQFFVRNSWGTSWGSGGYGQIPYEYLTSRYAHDFWTISQ